jgi:hypothetical protein
MRQAIALNINHTTDLAANFVVLDNSMPSSALSPSFAACATDLMTKYTTNNNSTI